VGQGISETIIKERKKHGDFQSLEDFLSRIHSKDMNKKSLESLIKSGALDILGERNQMLNNIETLLDFSRKKQKDKANGQSTLFGMITSNNNQINSLNLRNTTPAKREKKLLWEKELLGLFVSEHPLQEYEPLLQKYATPIIELEKQNSYQKIKVVGIATKVKKILTRKKEIMKFVKIEDPSGEIEVIVFPKMLKENSDFWQENEIISVTGRISHKDDSLKIIAEKAKKVEKEALDNLLLKNK
jgi:DNA polymerase-3 subunit alpha